MPHASAVLATRLLRETRDESLASRPLVPTASLPPQALHDYSDAIDEGCDDEEEECDARHCCAWQPSVGVALSARKKKRRLV
jgi:hypothetical protein